MKGSVTFDHIPTENLRGTGKTEKAAELKEFANLLAVSCPSGENYFSNTVGVGYYGTVVP